MKGLQVNAALVLGTMCFGVMNMVVLRAEGTKYSTRWTAGAGLWTDAAHWSDGLPTAIQRAEVHGNSSVLVPAGTYLAGDLEVALNGSDHARVEVDGGQIILMQDSLRLGEYTGGEGEFVLKNGAMHCVMDVFVGGADGVPGHGPKAVLLIEGGSFLGRTLTVGVGWGSESLLSVEGSRATAVHVLDYVYILGTADPNGKPGSSTLSFTLDEHGVTPITIQSHRRGLRIIKDARSRCRLQIRLRAVPPREDVTLVSGHVHIEGTFDDLPEGSEITAQYGSRTYRWQLTYRGGAHGDDLVLKNKSEYAADAPVTHTRPPPEIPKALWIEHPLFPLSAEKTGEPAFPEAEGFGAFTPGGRGGKTIYVDNLNDSGPGSLRAAIETSGPRTIVFRAGGVIPLKSTLVIRQPCITIDGQNGPGAGIMLRNHGIEVKTHDVVLRYFRVRVGDDGVRLDDKTKSYSGGDGEHAVYFTDGSKNCIADHLSLSWSTTKILSVTKMSDLITVQWCILSESLNFADHGYASIAGGNRVTWHHNLFAHNLSRNVRFQGAVDADFRDNLIYDWGETAAYGEFDRLNYIGNYLKAGPSTTQKPWLLFHNGAAVVMPGSLFVTNNILEGEHAAPGVNQDNWRGMGYYYERNTIAAPEPFPAPRVTTEPPQAAYGHVLKDAGAILPRRDAVDERIVREVRDGTGHIINWVKDVGGWPDFPSATAPSQGAQQDLKYPQQIGLLPWESSSTRFFPTSFGFDFARAFGVLQGL
jgi:pectate lyase